MDQQENSEIRISPDALIALVVAEAEDRDLSAMPSLEEMNAAFHPSEEFQKKMDKLLKRAKHKQEQKGAWHTAKRLFVVATTVVTVFACMLMPVQAVREAVVSTVLNWRDQFVEVVFTVDNDTATDFPNAVKINYQPKGFSLSEPISSGDGRYVAKYSSNDGDWYTIRLLDIHGNQSINLDNEYVTYYSVNFSGHSAVWGIMRDNSNELIWSQDNVSCQISGTLDISELLKMAESLSLS